MTATLKYLADLPLYRVEKPYSLYGFPEDVTPKSNCEFEIRSDITVQNARGREKDFTLEGCGFEFHTTPSKCRLTAKVFENQSERNTVWQYLNETIDHVRSQLKADKVLCFDWRVCHIGEHTF